MKIADFKLERYFAKHEFKAKYLLSSSDCETITLKELFDLEPGARQKLDEVSLGYSDTFGVLELRQQIANLYKTIKPEEVLAHTGAQEPILNLMLGLLKPTDHVVCVFPAYQSSYSVAQAIGCEVSFWKANRQNKWNYDLEEFAKLLKPNTKLVVINFPHNPTGAILSLADFKALIEMLKEREIYLLSDEIYKDLGLNPSLELPAACDLYDKAISLSGTAKSYGLAGLRVGWIATHDKDVYQKLCTQKDYTTICNSIVTETLATIALKHREVLWKKNREIVLQNIEIFKSFISKYSELLDWHPPQGGTITLVWSKTPKLNITALAQHLLDTQNVMILPGQNFDVDAQHFRLGLGRKNFADVLARFEAGLKSYLS